MMVDRRNPARVDEVSSRPYAWKAVAGGVERAPPIPARAAAAEEAPRPSSDWLGDHLVHETRRAPRRANTRGEGDEADEHTNERESSARDGAQRDS